MFQFKGSKSFYTILTVLLSAALLVFFQNCSQIGKVWFSDFIPTKSITSQNQDGYLGKPQQGEYVRTYPQMKCVDQAAVNSNLQGWIKISNQVGFTIERDNCLDLSTDVAYTDPNYDYRPYNSDYFGYRDGIYGFVKNKVESIPTTEVFCRKSDSVGGVDVVVNLYPDNTIKAKIYSGVVSGTGWINSFVAPFDVQRSSTMNNLTFSSSGFILSIDLSNSNLIRPSGQIQALIDNKQVDQSIDCRVMSNLPVITSSAAPNMAALWQLNGNYSDSSGNNNNGIAIDANATISFVPGAFQQSVSMDGVDDLVQIPASGSLDNLPQMTLSIWAWPADDGSGNSHGGLIDKGVGTGIYINTGWAWYISSNSTALIFEAAHSVSKLHARMPSGAFQVNQWNHFVVTWDGGPSAFNVRMYVNGVYIPNTSNTDAVGTRLSDAGIPVSMGRFNDYPIQFNGRLDQVGVWNRVLNPAEVANLYNQGLP